MDLDIKVKTIKYLEENREKYLSNSGSRQR